MKELLCLAVAYLTLTVESQFTGQTLNYYDDADAGRIYFEDNLPSYSNNVGFNPNVPVISTPLPNKSPYDNRGTTASNFDILASVQINNAKQNDAALNPATSSLTPQAEGVIPIPQNSFHLGPASTDFGVNVFKQIAKEHAGNVAVSPFSITILLALLQQGATGGTLDQISKVLQMTPQKSAEVYKQVTEEIAKRSSRNILKSANNIFLSDSFNLNTEFKRIAVNNFGSDLTPMSFGNSALAAQNINNWVASKTNNKLEKLLNQDALSANTQMVMLNAIYFKGVWEIPFAVKATKDRPFTLKDGEKISVPAMHTRRYLKAGVDKTANAKVAVLPFELNEYSLVVIVPQDSMDVDTVLSSLSMADVAGYLDLPAKDVQLQLPRFNIRADTDLKPVLSKMGVSRIFDRQAELFNLGIYGSFSPQVSSALHSAVLSIDEQGGSAAAATSFGAVALSFDTPALYFRANKPFLTILWDNRSSIPLFIARVMDPRD